MRGKTLIETMADFFGYSGGFERGPDRLIPYFDHIKPDVVILDDGAVMGMLRIKPVGFHLSSNSSRNGNARRHFAMLQLLADQQTEITETLVCHDDYSEFPGVAGGSAYWQEFRTRYARQAVGPLRALDWFISVVVRPRTLSAAWLAAKRRKAAGKPPEADRRSLRALSAKMRTISETLRKQSPVRLGLREEGGFQFSEIGEALHLIRTTKKTRIPLTQPAGSFAASLYRERVKHGDLGFLVQRIGGGETKAHVGRMLGFNVYPKKPMVGMFDTLLSDDPSILAARWVMTNTAKPITRAQATDQIQLTLNRLEKSGSKAETDMLDLENALDEIASAKEVRAQHSWTMAVHAPNMESLDDAAAAIADAVASGGCSPAPCGVGSEAAYWNQWPGNFHFRTAPATIGLKAFTALSPLEGYPSREEEYQWDAPLMRFKTAGGTAYDHGLGAIKHTLFCGPSGSGKTALLGSAITAATALIGERGTIIVWDKDRSNKIVIENNKGTYIELKRASDSGAAPLQRLRNTPEHRAVAVDLILSMILADNGQPVSERAKERIERGVAFVMRLPPPARTLGAVHAWLPPVELDPSDAASRLKPWCRGERMGWAMDGLADHVDFNQRMVGIDVTALLEDDLVLPVVSNYVLSMAGEVMDGRRMIFVVEELKFFLPKPHFTQRFEDIILTGRKKNVAFWPVIQQPESIILHPIGPAVLGQCQDRFLFKNELANRNAYCGGPGYGDGLHCTPQEFHQVREGMTAGAWSVLIQRPGKSVLCRFDLSSMPDDLLIVSGTTDSVKVWDSLADRRKEFSTKMKEATR